MYLIIDNGNSFLKTSVYDQLGNEIAFYEIKNDAISLSFFQEIFDHHKITKCYIGSVAPNLMNNVINLIKAISDCQIIIIKAKDFCDELDLSKFDLNELGVDILAYSLFLKKTYTKAIGICFGTALFAIGVSNSVLHGAIILPQIESGLKQLEQNTELIKIDWKEMNNKNAYLDFGYNTPTALISGINHAYNGIIMSICNYFYQTLKLNTLCITGGNSGKLIFDQNNVKQTKVYWVKNAVIKGYAFLIFNK